MRIQYARLADDGFYNVSDRLPVEQVGNEYYVRVGEFRFLVDGGAVEPKTRLHEEDELFVQRCDVHWHNGTAYCLTSERRRGLDDGRVLLCLDWSCPVGDWSENADLRDLSIEYGDFEPGMYVDAHDQQLLVEMAAEQHFVIRRSWSERVLATGEWVEVTQDCVVAFDGEKVLLISETAHVEDEESRLEAAKRAAAKFANSTARNSNSVTGAGSNGTSSTSSTSRAPLAGIGGRVQNNQARAGSTSQATSTQESGGMNTVTFEDVIGQEPAKSVLRKCVAYIRGYNRLRQMSADMPRGILLYGDAGNGKTLLARAMAGEAGVPFIPIDPSSLVSAYPGESGKKVKAAFAQVRQLAEQTRGPVIVFMDEIDAIGQQRPKGIAQGGEQCRIEALNALLQEMDGFGQHQYPVIVLGTTNRPTALDDALLRDGRFDRKIALGNPREKEMIQLIEHYSRELDVDFDVDFVAVAKKCAGLPASSAKRVCNEANLALFSADPDGDLGLAVSQEMFIQAAQDAVKEHIGKSKGKRFIVSDDAIGLKDVIGQPIAKRDVQDVIDYLRDPQRFKDAGAAIPSGMLFEGGAGLGKTRLARAVAGEAGVPFFSVAGSDFVEQYVGVGAKRVREVFEEARLNAPCIVFIDEIDAVGKRRSSGGEGGNSERDQTLNQILVEMDGFSLEEAPVVVLAASNLKDTLDPALLRPGRLSRHTHFELPEVNDRIALFEYYTRNKKLAKQLDLEFFARNTFGFSAASIENVCNEASLNMLRDGASVISPMHMDNAITRVTVGAPSSLGNVTEEDLRNTAVHEGGHAVVAWLGGGSKIARITVMPAGQSLGHVQYMNDDRHSSTKDDMFNRIACAMAGRVATELVLNCVDTGPSSDFETARTTAYRMVTVYGMSELGPITQIEGVERSETEKVAIENEVRKILADATAYATKVITENRAQFDKLVSAVLRKETILGPEFEAILAGKRVRAPRKVAAKVAPAAA